MDRPLASSEQATARDRILDAAERAMAEHGFHGVSLRDIAADCGLHFSLITHYFGTKHLLLESIFARRAISLNEERTVLLDRYVSSVERHGPAPRELIAAFCTPLFHLARRPNGLHFLRLQNIVFAEDGPASRQIKSRFYDPMSRRMVSLLAQALPGLPKPDVYLTFNYLVGATFGMIRDQTHAEILSAGEVMIDYALKEEFVLQLLMNGLNAPSLGKGRNG